MSRKAGIAVIVFCAIIIVVFVVTVILGGSKPKTNGTSQNSVIGNASGNTIDAPDFTVTLNDGSTFTLSDYKDKVVLVNFWATWCPPCVGEMPELERLKNDNIEGFEMVAINCSESKSTVDSFIKEHGYTFNVAYDENRAAQNLYPTDGIPYTLIIKNGTVVNSFLGAPRDAYNTYKSAVEECLK